MSDSENKKPKRPLKNTPPERYQPKVLLVWLGILTVIGVLFMMSAGNQRVEETLTIQQVIEAAEEGRIEKGAVIKSEPRGGRDWTVINGYVFMPSSSEGAPGERKSFEASGRLTDENVQKLQQTMLFEEKPSSTVMMDILLGVLPFIFIIGLLYFLFVRQLRSAGRGRSEERRVGKECGSGWGQERGKDTGGKCCGGG